MSIDHPDTLQPLLIDSAISTALPDDIVGVSGRLFTDRHGLVYSVRPVATSSTLANGTIPQKRRYDQAYSMHSNYTNDALQQTLMDSQLEKQRLSVELATARAQVHELRITNAALWDLIRSQSTSHRPAQPVDRRQELENTLRTDSVESDSWRSAWTAYQSYIHAALGDISAEPFEDLLLGPPVPDTVLPKKNVTDGLSLQISTGVPLDPPNSLLLGVLRASAPITSSSSPVGIAFIPLLESMLGPDVKTAWSSSTMEVLLNRVGFGLAIRPSPNGMRAIWPAAAIDKPTRPRHGTIHLTNAFLQAISHPFPAHTFMGNAARPYTGSFTSEGQVLEVGVGWFVISGRPVGFAFYPRLHRLAIISRETWTWESMIVIFGDVITQLGGNIEEWGGRTILIESANVAPPSTETPNVTDRLPHLDDYPILLFILHHLAHLPVEFTSAAEWDDFNWNTQSELAPALRPNRTLSIRISHGYLRCLLAQVESVSLLVRKLREA